MNYNISRQVRINNKVDLTSAVKLKNAKNVEKVKQTSFSSDYILQTVVCSDKLSLPCYKTG